MCASESEKKFVEYYSAKINGFQFQFSGMRVNRNKQLVLTNHIEASQPITEH